ncbi:MAG TPA: glycogen debranching protein, partial [Candidatus Wildermuthbacteria bacterium]|nr:glycogen debranching protein [Candidatus Wildermuthbacteria bacterium]
AALVRAGQHKKASQELELLAEANRKRKDKGEWGFQEWLHGKTGEAIGNSEPYQAWSAGMYLFAAECVSHQSVPYF